MIYFDLLFNLSLLVAFSIVSGFIEQRWSRHTRLGVLLQGALFGTVAVCGMFQPFVMGPGLIFDGRSVMLSLCAYFFGPQAAIVAGIMTIIYRIELGGVGTIMGICVIFSSIIIGLIAHYRQNPLENPPSSRHLYFFGLIVHIAMLLMVFTLPGDMVLTTMKNLSLPVMLLYPLATILAGKILSDQIATIHHIAALQETKRNLDVTLQSISEAVISTDLQGKVVLMNPVAEALTGWSCTEAKGKPLDEVFHIVDIQTREHIKNLVQKIINEAAEIGLSNYTLLIRRDGSEFQISTQMALIHTDNGESIGAVLSFRDITEQKLAEATLVDSEALFRNLFEHHASIKLNLDPETGDIIEANEAAARFYGWSVEQLKQMNIGQINILPPEKIKKVLEKAKKDIQAHYEFVHRLADGSIRDIEVFSSLITLKNKEILYLIIHDITERKQAEADLIEKEERYRAFIDSTDDLVFLKDAKLRYITVNQATAQFFGKSEEEIIGHTDEELVSDEFAQIIRHSDIAALEGNGIQVVEEIIDDHIYETKKFQVKIGKDQYGIGGYIRDITDRKLTENSLHLAAVGQLAAGVAHDFNNILAIMQMQAELKLMAPSEKNCIELGKTILRNIQRGAETCRNLMSFARPETPKRVSMCIEACIETTLSLAYRQLEATGISIIRKYQPDAHRVLIDPGQMEEVFLNLIINASHAMPNGGILNIATSYMDINSDGISEAIITVSDTGTGISPANINRIFDPFFTTKGRFGESDVPGNGLGLSVTHGIIRAHDGTISVQSEAGNGTTFKIILPVDPHPEQADEQNKTATINLIQKASNGLRILIADDEESIREVIVTTFQQLGFDVSEAADAQEAQKLLQKQHFDLLISDLMMPGGGGKHLLAEVQKHDKPPVVVIITGRLESVIEEEINALGANVCIQKPFNLENLILTVNKVLGLNTSS